MPRNMQRSVQPLSVTASAAVVKLASSRDFRVGVKNADDNDGVAELLIHGYIGDPWDQADAKSVIGFLTANKGKPVKVRINSLGGLAYDGIAIYNALVQHDGPVDVNIEGVAGSSATIIAMAGDIIRIAENGQFMIHRASTIAIGNTAVMLEVAEFLDKLDSQIAATYAARTGRTARKMLELMVGPADGSGDGTTYAGQEAVDARFADELIPLKKRQKPGEGDGGETDATADAKRLVEAENERRLAEASEREREAVAVRLRLVGLDDDSAGDVGLAA